MRTRWRAALAAVGVVFLVTGCSAADNGVSSQSASGLADGAAPPAKGAAPNGSKVTAPQPGASERKLARSARLELNAPKVPDAVSQARGIAEGAGGYTGQESTQDTTATLSLAVPSDRLDGVLDQLAKLGTPTKREMTTQDMTSQVVDVDARLATQRASVERMRALLAKATSVSEIASVESELTSREAALESLEQQQKSIAGSVAMATISLAVNAAPAAAQPKPDRSGFFGGLANGWDAFLAFGGGLLTVLGAIAPFLLIVVPLAWLSWWFYRRRHPPTRIPLPTTPE